MVSPYSGKRQFDSPTFAPVSATLGRTRQLFRFDVGDKIELVDLPGYGMAGNTPAKTVESWASLINGYMETMTGGRKDSMDSCALKRVVSLIDAGEGFSTKDEKLWDMAVTNRVPIQVVLTKCDSVTPMKLHQRMQEMCLLVEQLAGEQTDLKGELSEQNLIYPYIHAISATENYGMGEFRVAIAQIAKDWIAERKAQAGG